MPQITKEYKFCAAHQYWNNNWSEEENFDVFGKDIKNHGHNYILRVTVFGKINNESGFLVNLKWLNNIVEDNVISVLDHSQIDKDINHFKDKSPSTENLVVFIWNLLAPCFEGKTCKLYKIFLRETPTIYTEYYGPEGEFL